MMKRNFNLEDASQIATGAFALVVPVSFSEEAGRPGETLPISNLAILFIFSICFIGFFAYQCICQEIIRLRIPAFFGRIIIAYLFTALIINLLLLSLDKFSILTDTTTVLKRLIVITIPVSMSAIIVDNFDK